MQCLTDLGGGNYALSNPQPDTYTSCNQILVTPTEIQADIFNLSPVQGSQIALAIMAVWAIAFAYRAAIHALQTNEREYEND